MSISVAAPSGSCAASPSRSVHAVADYLTFGHASANKTMCDMLVSPASDPRDTRSSCIVIDDFQLRDRCRLDGPSNARPERCAAIFAPAFLLGFASTTIHTSDRDRSYQLTSSVLFALPASRIPHQLFAALFF